MLTQLVQKPYPVSWPQPLQSECMAAARVSHHTAALWHSHSIHDVAFAVIMFMERLLLVADFIPDHS